MPAAEVLCTNAKTFSPLLVPFDFRIGTTDALPEYREFLGRLIDFDESLTVWAPAADSPEYESLSEDVRHLEIAVWRDPDSPQAVSFHLFPNSIAVVEIALAEVAIHSSSAVEEEVQNRSRELIQDSWQRLVQLLRRVYRAFPQSGLLDPDASPVAGDRASISWTSRALMLNRAQVAQPSWQALITEWLSQTQCPGDAEKIIRGELDYSMTWLNYVVVDSQEEAGQGDYRLETMVLAQYIYTAQEKCNAKLKRAISRAYTSTRPLQVARQLEESRVASRLHQITYQDHLNYLTRPKRQLLDDILHAWEFDRLVTNGQLMIEACSSRIEEANDRRRERSSSLTDILLGFISFFAVFELSLHLTEFSRDAVSRPAFNYKDTGPSFFLSRIAEVDTDIMFVVGVVATLILFFIYRYIKSR